MQEEWPHFVKGLFKEYMEQNRLYDLEIESISKIMLVIQMIFMGISIQSFYKR